MDIQLFAASPCGRVTRTRTGYDAFVPDTLPPVLTWQDASVHALEQAALRIGELNSRLRDGAEVSLSLLAARDAVAAVRSEGTRLPLTAFFEDAATGMTSDGPTRLAWNFVAASRHGAQRLNDLPFSLRLVRELHNLLLDGLADPRVTPGRFRHSQNWIGPPGCTLSDATFVPPPATEMNRLLDNWERFLHEGSELPALARLSLAHHQFLAIQPFLDRNDLAGALTAAVALQHLGMTDVPLPVFGRLLERKGDEMQRRMLGVCATGAWENWITWYLHGLADAARETLDSAQRLRQVHHVYMQRLEAAAVSDAARHVSSLLFERPVLSPAYAAEGAGIATGAATGALSELESLGLVIRSTTSGQDVYVAEDIIASLEAAPLLSGGYDFPF